MSSAWLGNLDYWNEAYASGHYAAGYEWIQTGEVLWPFIERTGLEPTRTNVLHVGCGTSKLSKMLHDKGFSNLTNVDYSGVVIDAMRSVEPNLRWVCADCAEPGALGPEGAYDLCIDKGATDSLFEAGTDAYLQKGWAMVAEIHRVLRPNGIFLVFSNIGAGRPAFLKFFSSVEQDMIEGYSCDLYYKVICVLKCVK